MSSLLSLTLLGIRSFGPNEEDLGILKFLSPITLILGQNGCGKTTLIESLKFVTCGDVPENTNRGKDFIYDPKLANSSETKAFVKLKFRDINGDTLVITRPVQVTQKQKNLEFKRLDTAIKFTKPNGESTSLSSRCTDIDNLVTSSLGVSKAILTNVIFCHQEDSCWPLDEGKKVKEKFDAIFDAKKYNACLENIRKIRKDRQIELKIMKNDLKYLSERKNEASNKRAQLSETESRMSASRDSVKSLKDKLIPVSSKLREIAEKEDRIGLLQAEYGTYTTRLSSLQEMIKDLLSRIECEFPGTDEELEEAVNNFQEEFSRKQEKLKEIVKELEQTNVEIKCNIDKERAEDVKLNRLKRDNDRYNERLEGRNKVLTEICSELELKNVSIKQISENTTNLDKVIKSIQEAITMKQEDVADMKCENEGIIQQLQSEIDSLREEKAKTESIIDHKKEAVKNLKKDCLELKGSIESIDKSAESLRELETKMRNADKELSDLNSSHDLSKMNLEIDGKKNERDKLEKLLNSVENKIQSLQKLSGLKAEIDVLKSSKLSKEEDIKKLLRRHSEPIKQLLGEVPEQGIKLKFEAALSKINEEIRTKTEEIKIIEKEITKLEAEKRHNFDKLREAKQSLTSDECLIDQECGCKNYDDYLSELSTKVQEFQDQKGSISSSEYMFKMYLLKLEQEDPSCPLCHRDFPNEEEVNSLKLELTLKMRELPSKLNTSKEQLEIFQEKYKKMLQLKPKFDKLSNIKKIEIPALQKDLEKTDEKLDKTRKRLNDLQKELSEPKSNEELAKNIQGDIVLLEQYWIDVRKAAKELQKLESKFPPESEGCNLEEALGEQDLLRSKLKGIRSSLEREQSILNSVSLEKQKLQEEINAIQDQQMKISGNAQMRSQLVEKLKENETKLSTSQMEIAKSSDQLSVVSVKLEGCSRNIKSQTDTNSKTLQDSISKLKLIEGKFMEINKMQKEIAECESYCIPEKIKNVQINISELHKANEKLLEKKETMKSEEEKLKSHLASQKSYERSLEDNIKLRSKQVEEKNTIEKVNSLKILLGSTDHASITMEKNKLRQLEEGINRERAQAEGRLRELENTLSNIKKDLDQDFYKNAEKNYRDKLIQIKVEETSIDDLNKFYVALDWALTHFHQEKMRAINSTIRDLWREIYRGNDIDSIEIKADVDSSLSADKRRTYHYRVVQKKNRVEMEMRGRCSAGQKVLACLIIRMALAETFSANCGVLALDEPTTNLDEANIHSLSEALVQIVTRRSAQKNFQLIIISHDRSFLDVLQRIDKAQYYYKIHRNKEGRSRIERLDVQGAV